MSSVRTIIHLTLFLVISACTAGTKLPATNLPASLPGAPQPAPSARLIDPEEAFQSAVESCRNGHGETALVICRSIEESHPQTVWYRRALFVEEQAQILLDRPEAADAAMLRARDEYPEMADYAVFILADYHFSRERYSRAAALYGQAARYSKNSKSALAERAAYRAGVSLAADSSDGPAADAFAAFLSEYPSSEYAADACLALGRALEAQGRADEAVRAYRDAWILHPGNETDEEAEQALAGLRNRGVKVPPFSVDELYQRGSSLYRSARWSDAIGVFREILDKGPSRKLRPEVLLRTGVALYRLGRRGEAAVVLEKMAIDYPANRRTPEALYWIGKSFSRLGDWNRSIRTFRKLLGRYPESEWADEALYLIGNIYRETGDMNKAGRFYGRLVRDYPRSRYADSALWWRAWSAYTAGAYPKAVRELRKIVDVYPRSFLVKQALYWLGRIAEKRGDHSGAAAYYSRVLKQSPYTYYGYRAADRLALVDASAAPFPPEGADLEPLCVDEECDGDPGEDADAAEYDDGPPAWTEETKKMLSADPSFRKTLELMHLAMKKEAALELRSLRHRIPKRRGMLIGLSKAFFELGDYSQSLLLVLRSYERYLEGPKKGISDDLWLLAYPQGYWDSIRSYAKKYGQDPYFIAAIIRRESRFSCAALSPAGARGLMQVMPRTGAWAARRIKLGSFDRDRLFDSDTAINIGTWYISWLMKRFGGEPLFVAAAYNAGPEAVASWIASSGPVTERDVFVESIPFSETRTYVKKVLRNYAEYRRIYGNPKGIAEGGRQNGTGGTAREGS